MSRAPETLPEKLFLLAYDTGRRRLAGGMELRYALRAAALADLVVRGLVRDDSGKARVESTPTSLDPTLRALWEDIEAARPRSWRRWLGSGGTGTLHAIRDGLAEAGVIRLEPRRILGIFPATRITLRQPREVSRLAEDVGRAIRGGNPASRVDAEVAALAALAGAAGIRTVLKPSERRRFSQRLATLGQPIEPIPTVLRRAISATRAAYAGG